MPSAHRRAEPESGAGAFDAIAFLLAERVVTLDGFTGCTAAAAFHARLASHATELRAMLHRYGPADASQLAQRSGLAADRIGGMLYHDVHAGRVRTFRRAGVTVYALASRP